MSTTNNVHITRYLDYYISLKHSPEFAVLLRGNWGNGKSWFIKNYIKKHNPIDFLYVSLYGVSSNGEIEESFFEQLHPILASKGMKIAAKILKGALMTTLKINLDGKKSELDIASGLPDIQLPEYLKKLDGKVLVFDDLERCALPIHQILGYINQYVENGGLKVIIVANEDEIIKTDNKNNKTDDAERYLTIKEKLIGKSFDVQSDEGDALADFIKSLESSGCKKYVKRTSWVVLNLFKTAEYGNLRHLRQSLLDFDRFYRLLDKGVIACDPLMQHIFTLFLIISFELKKGAIHENDIPDLFSLSYLIRKTNETKSNVELIKGKYSIFKTYAFHPVAKEIWTELFRTGTTDKDELNQQLFDSSYLASNTTPAWQQLYYFENLEDERFIHVQNAVYEELVGNKFTNPYFVIQAVGILIFLSQAKLNNHSVEHLIGLGKLNLDILKKKGHLNRMELKKFPGDHSHGLGYAAKGVSAYDDFLKYCAEFATQAEKDEWPKRARVLLSDLKKSPKRFCSKIDNDSPNGMAFVQIPILTYIEPETFVEEILLMPNSDKRLILDSLESRYKYGSITELSLEAKWLKSIITNLEQKAEYLKGTLAGYLIFSKIIPSFKSHLSRLPQSEI